MAEFLSNNYGNILVLVIITAVVFLIVFFGIKKKKNGQSGCAGGCIDCPMKNGCEKKKNDTE